jgi:SAM-dependent methyltransferase
MTDRARSFGAAASTYERHRPDYPDSLVDAVLDHARRPVRTALEIGAGTGKATRVFAARGIAVTATDPDPGMLTELRRRVPDSVVVVEAAFEDLPRDATYDLVYAAASLHWTRSEGRWSRVAALLAEGGVFASFGGTIRPADPVVEDSARRARTPFLAEDEVPAPDGTPADAALQWPGTELSRAPWFTDVRQSVIERPLTMSARAYVDHLATVSAYLQLTPDVRDQALASILRVLPDPLRLKADITLHLARRVAT